MVDVTCVAQTGDSPGWPAYSKHDDPVLGDFNTDFSQGGDCGDLLLLMHRDE